MTIYSQDNSSIFKTKTGQNITFYGLKEKECPRCLKNFFPKHPRTAYCHSKECNKLYYKEQYQKNSATFNREEKYPLKNCTICAKEFRPRSLSNTGVCGSIQCKYKQRLVYNQTHKIRVGKSNHKKYYMKQYGLTIEQFEQLEEEQNHCCKICNKHTKTVKL